MNLIQTLEGHSLSVNSVSFSRDGTKVASGSGDKTVKLWDVKTGALLHNLEGHSDEVTCVSFQKNNLLIEVRNKLYTYYSLEYEKQLIEATHKFVDRRKEGRLPDELIYHTIVNPLAFESVTIAIQVPNEKGFILARLNPKEAKEARIKLRLPAMFPLAFYKNMIIFFINGIVMGATLNEILATSETVKSIHRLLRELQRPKPPTSSVSTQTINTADDDSFNEPQPKKQRTHELELLALRF